MVRDVSTLNAPPSRAGARAQQTTGQQAIWLNQRQYQGQVLTEPSSAGRCRVSIGGESKVAYLSPTAKAVGVGDAVNVAKGHGRWVVTENLTWHEPPPAGPPPSTSTPAPAQSATYPGISRRVISSLPQPSGSSNNQLYAHAQRTSDRFGDMRLQMNSLVDDLRDILPQLYSLLSNNANRQNQVRDVATSTRDSMSGIRQGALQDRIVR